MKKLMRNDNGPRGTHNDVIPSEARELVVKSRGLTSRSLAALGMTALGVLATATAAWAQQATTAPAPHAAPAAAAAPAAHAAPVAAAPVAPAPSPTANFGDRYAILADKNIFVRNRPATRTPGAQRSVTRRVEETMVLTGIALQEGRHVAFLEDSAAHQTKRLLPGDQIAGGTITEVSIDSMEFEAGGKRIHIPIGRNLLGELAPVVAAPVAESSSSQPAVASSSGNSGRSASNERDRGRSSSRNGSNSNSNGSNSRDGDRGRDSGNGRDSRTVGSSTSSRDLRERDPAAPSPEGTITVAPGSPASPALPNDPNLSLEERMRLRAQQLRGENK
jgi:hypothetical protein